MKKIMTAMLIAIAGIGIAAIASQVVQSTYAQLPSKDPGASFLAPGQKEGDDKPAQLKCDPADSKCVPPYGDQIKESRFYKLGPGSRRHRSRQTEFFSESTIGY